MCKFKVGGDGLYYKGLPFDIDLVDLDFCLTGLITEPRLMVIVDIHPNQKLFKNDDQLIYTDKTFLSDIINFFIESGVPKKLAKSIDYSEHGLQDIDDESQVIDFDLDYKLAKKLLKLGLADDNRYEDEDEE